MRRREGWKRWGVLCTLFVAVATVACAPVTRGSGSGNGPLRSPTPASTPTPGVERVTLQVERAVLRSGTGERELVVTVALPDTCTEARHAVSRDGSRVRVELWGERPTDVFCAQVLVEQEIVIPLGAAADTDVVEVNGVEVMAETETGSFDSGLAMVEQVEVRVGEGLPAPVVIEVQGTLPDACSELAEHPSVTVDGQRVTVQLQWKRPQGLLCAQVLRPFSTAVELGTLAPGTYTLVVNDFELSFTVEASQS